MTAALAAACGGSDAGDEPAASEMGGGKSGEGGGSKGGAASSAGSKASGGAGGGTGKGGTGGTAAGGNYGGAGDAAGTGGGAGTDTGAGGDNGASGAAGDGGEPQGGGAGGDGAGGDGAGGAGAGGEATCSPRVRWAKRFGNGSFQQASAIAMDTEGGVAVTGHFRGTIDFGGDTFSTTPDSDVFVARFDADGEHVFSRSFQSNSINASYDVAIDTQGAVVITGYIRGTADFGAGPVMAASSSPRAFLAKYAPSGDYVFGKRFESSWSGEGHGVTTDLDDNVIAVGWAGPQTDFGGGPDELGNAYVAKYTPDGDYLWSTHFGDASASVRPYSARADSVGNIVVSGTLSGSVDFGGGVRPGGTDDIFLLKLDPEGNHIFSYVFGGAGIQSGYGVALDGQDRIFLTGFLEGSIDFGGGMTTSAGSFDTFTAAFDANGGYRFGPRFGDMQSQGSWDVAADAAGNFAIIGTANGSPDFGGGQLASNGLGDVFFARFDDQGNHQCSGMYGDTDQQGGLGIATNGSALALAGYSFGVIDFGPGGRLQSGGSGDVFVAVLDL